MAGAFPVIFTFFACGDVMRDPSTSQHTWFRFFVPMTIVVLGMLSGCDPTPSTESDSSITPISTTGDATSGSLSSRPDESVRVFLKAFRDGEAGVIWDSLPNRHHVEINEIIRGFAGKMDQKIWERVFVVAQRIIKVLRDKRKLIIGNPDLKFAAVNKRLFSENWDEMMALLQLVVDSELADLDKLRTFDGKTFFYGTGTRFLKKLVSLSAKDPNDPFRKGFDAKVRLVSLEGTEAKIGLMMSGTFVMTQQAINEKPKETQMKVHQVDGVWIVEELDYGLSKLYADGRAMLGGIPDNAIRDNRGPLIKLLETVEEDLGRIELAKTSKELTQALVLAQLRVSQLLSANTQEEAGAESTGDSVPLGRTVTVVVRGEMNKATRQRVLDLLESLKRPGGTPRVLDGKGLVTVIIPTDRFLQDVVDAIDFGSVGDIDEVERRLTVTVKPTPEQPKKAKPDSSGK